METRIRVAAEVTVAPLAKLEGEEAAPVPVADVTTRVVKMPAEH